jgi:hypothetical protein
MLRVMIRFLEKHLSLFLPLQWTVYCYKLKKKEILPETSSMTTITDLLSWNFDKTAYLDVPEGIAVAIV